MKIEQKYYKIKQGEFDNDDKYREFGGNPMIEKHGIDKLIEWNLATEISIINYFEGKAPWGSGFYANIGGKWICSSSDWDSSG